MPAAWPSNGTHGEEVYFLTHHHGRGRVIPARRLDDICRCMSDRIVGDCRGQEPREARMAVTKHVLE